MLKMQNSYNVNSLQESSKIATLRWKIPIIFNLILGVILLFLFILLASTDIHYKDKFLLIFIGCIFLLANNIYLLFIQSKEKTNLSINIENSNPKMDERDFSELTRGIAHDFNNILTTLSGILSISLIDIQEKSQVDLIPILRENLDIALKATHRATGLTRQLLSFSKGGQPIRKNSSLEEIIKDSTKFILAGSSVANHFNISRNIPPIDFDPDQISQVVQNLVLNAKQAMSNHGNLYIELSYYESEYSFFKRYGDIDLVNWKGNNQKNYSKKIQIEFPCICFSIQDDGPGINPEIREKIFHINVTTKNEGNGLGLVSSCEIIRRHHGEIAFSTKLGIGTTFFVFLPITKQNNS